MLHVNPFAPLDRPASEVMRALLVRSVTPNIPQLAEQALQARIFGHVASALPATGRYTPTLTGVANVAASTAYECQFTRVGELVVVSGKVDVDPTAAVSTQLGISLPIASNLGAAEHCAGTAVCPTIASQSAAILGDATNDRAQMEWIAADITNQPMYFIFMYRIRA